MHFGDHLSLKSKSNLSNILLLNICLRLGDKKLLSVLQAFTTIAKQAMPFGDRLLLKKRQQFQ
jgi:hypothetical protein